MCVNASNVAIRIDISVADGGWVVHAFPVRRSIKVLRRSAFSPIRVILNGPYFYRKHLHV